MVEFVLKSCSKMRLMVSSSKSRHFIPLQQNNLMNVAVAFKVDPLVTPLSRAFLHDYMQIITLQQ